jgi:hypothetical protein
VIKDCRPRACQSHARSAPNATKQDECIAPAAQLSAIEEENKRLGRLLVESRAGMRGGAGDHSA